jgi:GNAT superfamily N-acetyltransferase
MLKVKHVEMSDVDEVLRVANLFFKESRFSDSALDKEQWKTVVNTSVSTANYFMQVLKENDKIRGFIQAGLQQNLIKNDFCAIQFVFLEKEYRGRGYAEQFLNNVKDWATINNCYEIIAGDFGFQPEKTGKWYASQGYKTVGQQYAIKI